MKVNDKYSNTYQFGRALGVPVFKGLYKPTIVNSDAIPKEGPVILAGNHLHVWDQCPVMCATKRTIHWLAKKEYFEGKLKLMYKYMGCIPVDRFGDSDDSKNIALEYLKQGNVIGIFPEGTRNHVKERDMSELLENINDERILEINSLLKFSKLRLSEIKLLKKLYNDKKISLDELIDYINFNERLPENIVNNGLVSKEEYSDSMLLPFKYGAVSMANKTHAPIIPFGVSGDYRVNSKNLIVEFGSPIIVHNNDLETANIELKNSISNILTKQLKK